MHQKNWWIHWCTSNTFVYNIISIIFQKRSLKCDKASFVLRKLSWESILARYCSTETPILLSSDEIKMMGQQSLVNCVWMVRPIRFNNNNNREDNTSTGESLSLSSNFRAFQILSDTFKYSQIFSSRSAEQIQAIKCWLSSVNMDS